MVEKKKMWAAYWEEGLIVAKSEGLHGVRAYQWQLNVCREFFQSYERHIVLAWMAAMLQQQDRGRLQNMEETKMKCFSKVFIHLLFLSAYAQHWIQAHQSWLSQGWQRPFWAPRQNSLRIKHRACTQGRSTTNDPPRFRLPMIPFVQPHGQMHRESKSQVSLLLCAYPR